MHTSCQDKGISSYPFFFFSHQNPVFLPSFNSSIYTAFLLQFTALEEELFKLNFALPRASVLSGGQDLLAKWISFSLFAVQDSINMVTKIIGDKIFGT